MRRLIGMILIILLLMGSTLKYNVVGVSAQDIPSEKEKLMLEYMNTDDGKLLIFRKNYGYMNFVQEFKGNAYDEYLLQMTDLLIDSGAEPDEKRYIEVLINIMGTYELDNAIDISEQYKMDNLKSVTDYAMDITEMSAEVVSIMSGLSASSSELETAISRAVSVVSTAVENTDNWIDGISDLETIIYDYTQYDEFLTVIEENAEGNLKSAASTLKNGLSKSIQVKLETYNEISDKNFENYGEIFFTESLFGALKLMDEYRDDSGFQFMVDSGNDFISKVDLLKDSWDLGKKIGVLVGDVVVGGENLINRLLEMMAIYDISVILQDQLITVQNQFLDNYGAGTNDENIRKYFSYSQYLIGARIRGEYCLYSIVAKDAGLLSWFNKKSAEEAEQWYKNKCEKILKIQEALNKVNVVKSENSKDDIYQYTNDTEQILAQLGAIYEDRGDVYLTTDANGVSEFEVRTHSEDPNIASLLYRISVEKMTGIVTEENVYTRKTNTYTLKSMEIKQKVLEHYNSNIPADDGGKYIIADNEIMEDDTAYYMDLRYCMSDEKAAEIIAQGGYPSANRLVGTVVVDKNSGRVSLDTGTSIDTWDLY